MGINNKKTYLIFGLLLLVSALFLFYSKFSKLRPDFIGEVEKCNTVQKELRFGCYRSAMGRFYKEQLIGLVDDVKKDHDLLSFKSPDSSYAIFGTNCHTFYHSLGDFIATGAEGQNLESKVGLCPTACTSGCIMGLYKRTALADEFSEETLKSFYPACPEASRHQCAHEVGHLLHDKYVVSVLKTLDEVSEKQYGLKRDADYKYTTFENPDLNAPFEDCKKLVPKNELVYCYTGVGHNLFLFSEFSPDGYKTFFRECEEKADQLHRDDCYAYLVYRIGINDAATKFLAGDFEEGRKVCREMVELTGIKEMGRHCYLGVGGGIGLFVDSEFANAKITDENLAAMQKEVLRNINLCEESEGDLKLECYKGLLGTRIKKLYKELNIQQIIIDEILPQIKSDFEIVG